MVPHYVTHNLQSRMIGLADGYILFELKAARSFRGREKLRITATTEVLKSFLIKLFNKKGLNPRWQVSMGSTFKDTCYVRMPRRIDSTISGIEYLEQLLGREFR